MYFIEITCMKELEDGEQHPQKMSLEDGLWPESIALVSSILL